MALQHLRSSTANKRPLPAGMGDGQLAINTNLNSPGIFFKDSNGDLVKAGPVHVGATAPNVSPAAGGQTGNTTGELWLDTSLTPNELKTWSGSAWVSATGQEIPVSKLIDGSARQLLQTDAAGTGVEWTSNIDVPGTLDVTGATTLDSTLTVPLGSAAAPTLRFTGDPNTGLYSPGADQVAISTNGTQRATIDSSGRVLIGTTNAVSFGSRQVLAVANGVTGGVLSLYNSTTATANPRISSNPTGGEINDIGIHSASTNGNIIAYTNNDTERLRITSDGKVGLGTSVPGSLLELGQGSGPQLTLRNTNSASNGVVDGTTLGILGFAGTDFAPLGEPSVAASIRGVGEAAWTGGASTHKAGLAFLTQTDSSAGKVERMRIDNAGRVGIGTTSPAASLHVRGTSQLLCEDSVTANYFQFRTSGGEGQINSYLSSTAAMPIVFKQYTAERARIDSAGRLLVGTSSASQSAFLQVQGRSGALTDYAGFSLRRGSLPSADGQALGAVNFTDNSENLGAQIYATSDGGSWTSGSNHRSRLVFTITANGASSPTERMKIAQDGSVTTFATNGRFQARTSAGPGTTVKLYSGAHSATSTSSASTECFIVYSNGNVENAGNSYGAMSDIKLKENIVDAKSQWDDLKGLRVVNYNFKPETGNQTHKQLGLIAQEVEAVCPALVGESPDLDEDGNDLGTVTKSISYSVLYMKAVKALQEAIERIETLEAKVTALEGN